MANANTSRVDTRTPHWFNRINGICFPKTPLTITDLLHLLLAPMCAPCRNGYGSSKGKSGRAKTGINPANTIAKNQSGLIAEYIEYLESPSLPQGTDRSNPTAVAQVLAQELVRVVIPTNKDANYSGKADRCTSDHFLSFFSGAIYLADKDASGMMDLAVTMYAEIAKQLYTNAPGEMVAWIRDKLSATVLELCPRLSFPDFSDPHRELGWKICVMLLLSAWQDKPTADATALVNVLLGTEMPEVAFSDAPVAPTGTVTLDMGPFRTVLAAAMRSELDLREIRACFAILTALHQSSPSFPPPALVQGFLERISSLFAQKRDALDDDDRYDTLAAEMAELRSIRKECEKFLPGEP